MLDTDDKIWQMDWNKSSMLNKAHLVTKLIMYGPLHYVMYRPLHYLKTCDLLLNSDLHSIKAVRLGDGSKAWELSGEVEGKEINPWEMASDEEGRVFVADGGNCRVLCLDGESGHVLQVFTDIVGSYTWDVMFLSEMQQLAALD